MAYRWLLVLTLATGCKDKFQADVMRFCEAATKHKDKVSFAELAPTFADDLETDEFRDMFVVLRSEASIGDFEIRMREAMKRARVERCPTLDLMMSRVRRAP